MRISDWSSDVCSSDLVPDLRALCVALCQGTLARAAGRRQRHDRGAVPQPPDPRHLREPFSGAAPERPAAEPVPVVRLAEVTAAAAQMLVWSAGMSRGMHAPSPRSEAHTSELQSLMRISYAVF